jgi:hemerythrin-like domain-containing protein
MTTGEPAGLSLLRRSMHAAMQRRTNDATGGTKRMSELTELGGVLHEEHFRILMLICGLENRISGESAAHPLDPRIDEERGQLAELSASLDEIIGHNAFEEAVLFPLICEGGEGDLAALLTHEHVTIGPLAKRLRSITGEILQHGISADRWREFRDAAAELVSEMMLHLQKEELTVVQRLASFVDAEMDHQLALKHGAERLRHRVKLTFAKKPT